MFIKIRTLTGRELELHIEATDKMLTVKEKVEEQEGVPPAQQRLIYKGKQMLDEKIVGEYGVEEGVTLHLVLALRGGD
ncbi:hypothetical protein EYC84_011192 [Monilinia fructicola]|uniref:Ubiquitin-like domain-containing protein n=1 Tax=Monilinia fructicola TaxID=38448 RepID=A0A5M9J9B5_MONFR|nr:hypothetical protein EYC84_011192 [Monilinia fructicola]